MHHEAEAATAQDTCCQTGEAPTATGCCGGQGATSSAGSAEGCHGGHGGHGSHHEESVTA